MSHLFTTISSTKSHKSRTKSNTFSCRHLFGAHFQYSVEINSETKYKVSNGLLLKQFFSRRRVTRSPRKLRIFSRAGCTPSDLLERVRWVELGSRCPKSSGWPASQHYCYEYSHRQKNAFRQYLKHISMQDHETYNFFTNTAHTHRVSRSS